MALTLYFLRHGQTTFSRDNGFCGSGIDVDLTDKGHEMARQFARAYHAMPWAAVYASPLRRALATAKPLCSAIGATPRIHDDLREIGYGKWEGRTAEDVSRDFHDDYVSWSADAAFHAPTGGGETAIAIERRVLGVLEEVTAAHQSGNVLLVSHKATIRVALASLLGIELGRFRDRLGCPVASVSVVEMRARGPLLKALADRAHLDEALRAEPGT